MKTHQIFVTLTIMSLCITSLNSGSNGNCYYIGNEREAVLIDAGLSCRETEKRMKRLGLQIEKVRAIFVSHEHTDHITGIPVLSQKYQLPVYITANTLLQSRISVKEHLVHSFTANIPLAIGGLLVTAFTKLHDAVDPHSFTISADGIVVGVFTDIGSPCKNVMEHFMKCNAAFLEANYDENLLMNGNYPFHLKKRIASDNGHLSNDQALKLFLEYKSSFMSHLILSHLSKNNNTPELVQALFDLNAGNTAITVASRYKETAVFNIDGSNIPLNKVKSSIVSNPLQLSLF